MSALTGRKLPPPQPRRVLPSRASRFKRSYESRGSSKEPLSLELEVAAGTSSKETEASGSTLGQLADGGGDREVGEPVATSGVSRQDKGKQPAHQPSFVPPRPLASSLPDPLPSSVLSDISGLGNNDDNDDDRCGEKVVVETPAPAPSIAPPASPVSSPPPLVQLPSQADLQKSSRVKGAVTNSIAALKPGAKVFQCAGFGDCTMIFTRSEHLARHIRKHTGQKPFVCHCNKAFSRVDNLRQHCATCHPLMKELNERTIGALRTQHTELADTTTTDLKKYIRTFIAADAQEPAAAQTDGVGSMDEDDLNLPLESASHGPVPAPGPQPRPAADLSATPAAKPKKKKSKRKSKSTASKASLTAAHAARKAKKPSVPSRFAPSPFFSPAFSQGLPTTPAEQRPATQVQIASGSNYDSPYSSYPHHESLVHSVDSVAKRSAPVRKDLAAVSQPRPLLTQHASSGSVTHFSQRHFKQLSSVGGEQGLELDSDPVEPARPTLPSAAATNAAPARLLPSPLISGQDNFPAVPPMFRSNLPPLPPAFASRGYYGPPYPPRSARFALPAHLTGHGAAARAEAGARHPSQTLYSMDYSLSSARTRMSSSMPHGRESISGAFHATPTPGPPSWALGSYPAAPPPLTPVNWPRFDGYAHRTIHSTDAPSASPSSAPLAGDSARGDPSTHELMELAVEKTSAPVDLEPESTDDALESPKGALWGDPSQDNSPQSAHHHHQVEPNPRFYDDFAPGPSLGARPMAPVQQPMHRFELAFSPPQPQMSYGYWAPPPPIPSWAVQPPPPVGTYPSIYSNGLALPGFPVDQYPVVDDTRRPLDHLSAEGPMLCGMSPLPTSVALFDTPPSTSSARAFPPSLQHASKLPRGHDEVGSSQGRAALSARRKMHANLARPHCDGAPAPSPELSNFGVPLQSSFSSAFESGRAPKSPLAGPSQMSTAHRPPPRPRSKTLFTPPAAAQRPPPSPGCYTAPPVSHTPNLTIAVPPAHNYMDRRVVMPARPLQPSHLSNIVNPFTIQRDDSRPPESHSASSL